VLEVGTGSGYQTAVLAHLAAEVYSIDRYRTLVDAAENRLATLKLSNIEVKAGDGFDGWPEKAPFDRIIVTAAYRLVPPVLIDQLRVGGILLMPVGPEHGVQTLIRVERTAEGSRETRLIDVRFVPMVPGQAQKL
ncbi:MAG: methyltransferase domain-containing protein, partial [Hyphomicrobiales bacterium]|nr:methyltransferase domain-containing protein [Hyphomicrobiales bacterium]